MSEEREYAKLDRFHSLPQAVLAARRQYGSKAVAFEDIEGNRLTLGRLALAGTLLGHAFRRRFRTGERVGVLLPSAPGSIAVLLGFWRSGRVPALINPTVGAGPMLSALRTAECRTVLSSRTFIAKGKLDAAIEAIEGAGLTMVWTEDLRAGFGIVDKARAFVLSRFTARGIGRETEAAVLFTSGTEGTPKGVALTHGNLLANVAQLQARANVGPHDRAVSPLPLFHSFGLTAGVVFPLLCGIRTGLHPSPLHYRVIPELAMQLQATLLIGTDTFLAAWARRAGVEHFGTLRAVIAGAEPVKAATRATWAGFGATIYEGYGATETGPVMALNVPEDHVPGTVGRLLPGIEHRLEAVPGVEGHRLSVRGRNVMAGYLMVDAPGRVIPPVDGWYDTGDVVRFTESGHLIIVGRSSASPRWAAR